MIDHMKYVVLSVLIITWCFLHSAMISITVTEYIKKNLGSTFRYYRLFYCVVSVITLVPVVLLAYSIRTQPLFAWEGYLRIGQIFFLGSSAALFVLGARHYDARQFLGLKQLRDKTMATGITTSGSLDTSGILGVIRHPWYAATFLLIWARPLDISAILVNAMLSAYLIIGTVLEENKLIKEFGDEYRAYQNRVPMFIPYKWLTSKRKVL
jgi:protein-S-isoprenylcysteine O-methyltransferase Ste14